MDPSLLGDITKVIVVFYFFLNISVKRSGIRYHFYDMLFSVFPSSSKPFKRPERVYGSLLEVGCAM